MPHNHITSHIITSQAINYFFHSKFKQVTDKSLGNAPVRKRFLIFSIEQSQNVAGLKR